MLRCCLLLLLILGIIASPLAAMPHAHAEMSAAEKCEHDQTPHFHMHSHGDHHGHDSQCEGGETSPNAVASPSNDASDELKLNYFHGAICFEVQTEALCKINQLEEIQAKTFPVTVINWLEASLTREPVMRSSPLWQPPDSVLDESTIYLTLRNLRI